VTYPMAMPCLRMMKPRQCPLPAINGHLSAGSPRSAFAQLRIFVRCSSVSSMAALRCIRCLLWPFVILGLAGCAYFAPSPRSPPSPDGQLITLENRPGPFCGRCDNVKIIASSNGRVWIEHGYWLGQYSDWIVERSSRRVPVIAFAQFREKLSPFRPNGTLSLNDRPPCTELSTDFDGAEVRWLDATGSSRLVYDFSCDPKARETMANAIREAPKLLGLDGLKMPWGQWVASTSR
jgi:hypothetical protein